LPRITPLAVIAALIFTASAWLLFAGQVPPPTVRAIDDLALPLLSFIAAAFFAVTARSEHGRARAAWVMMAVALAAFGVGEAIWCYDDLFRKEVPFPSSADAFFLIFPIGACAALLFLRNRSNRESQGRIVFDGLIVAGSLFIVSWTLVLKRIYEAGAATRLEFVLLMAYPVADIVVLTIAASVLATAMTGQRVTISLLTLGLLAMVLADSGYAYLSSQAEYVAGSRLDIVWVAGLLLLTLAAAAAGRQTGLSDRAADEVPGWASVWLPYTPLMVALIVAIAHLPGAMSSGPALPVALLLVITVLARQLLAVRETRRLMARVTDRAMHDPLTGLANRVLFQDRLTDALENRPDGQSMGVLVLDLNHFKMVNDTLGHSAGDELLRAVADRIRDGARAGGIVARLGGDEFAVLIGGSAERIGRIANRLVESFDAPFVIDGHELLIRPSAGLSIAEPTGGQSADELVNQADKAMYSGKRSEAVGVHVFTAETDLADNFDSFHAQP
jgi:diguanylate cyclase (GGDEF)-like protein